MPRGNEGVYPATGDHTNGITVRDRLAMEALSALLGRAQMRPTKDDADVYAEYAYAFADAMLIQREK